MSTPNTNFDAYLSYLRIDDGKILINGSEEFEVSLPRRLNTRTLESRIFKSCQEYNIDCISEDTVRARVKEAINDYKARKRSSEGNAAEKGKAMMWGVKMTKAQEALDLVKENCKALFIDQHGTSHAEVIVNNRAQAFPIRSGRFRNWLSLQYYNTMQDMLSGEDITNVCNILEAEAAQNGNRRTLHLRVGGDGKEVIYYDLTNSEYEAIKVTASGWSKEPAPVIFAHYNNQLPQVLPLTEYDADIFEKFLALANLKSEDDRLLLKCYIVSLFFPDIPKPILMLHGEQGSAKSTLQEMIKMLVDPSSVLLLSFPRDVNELIQVLAHNFIAYFDNISYVKEWASDQLCRAVTGASFSKRVLFSNDDDFLYHFRRNIGFNGVNIGASKPDLLERGLIIQLERIPKEKRRKIKDIWHNFESLRSQLLGFILDILVRVLQSVHQGGIELKELPRMADWAEVSELISRCMGNADGAFLEAYYRNIGLQTEEAIEANPIAQCIAKLMEGRTTPWVGSATNLLDDIESIASDVLKMNLQRMPGWPKAPNALSRRLNEVATNLREVGIVIDRIHDPSSNIRLVQIRKIPPESPKPPENRGSSGNHDRLTGDESGGTMKSSMQSPAISPNEAKNESGGIGDSGDNVPDSHGQESSTVGQKLDDPFERNNLDDGSIKANIERKDLCMDSYLPQPQLGNIPEYSLKVVKPTVQQPDSSSRKTMDPEKRKRLQKFAADSRQRFLRLDRDAKIELVIKAQRALDNGVRGSSNMEDSMVDYFRKAYRFAGSEFYDAFREASDAGIIYDWITPSAYARTFYSFDNDAAQKFEDELRYRRQVSVQNGKLDKGSSAC